MKQILFIFLLIIPGIIKSQTIIYPESPSSTICDTFFNTVIIDEYRCLEDLTSETTIDWVKQENKLTRKYLKKASLKCNSYVAIDRYSYIKYDKPVKHGDYYFEYAYYNNVGLPAIFYQSSLNDDPSIIVDPNYISRNDKIMIDGIFVSGDSKYMAYQYNRNGSDRHEIGVVNLKSGTPKSDHLEDVMYSNISWKDEGFYYSKFETEKLGKVLGQEVYYHKLGTNQSDDVLIFKRENNPEALFYVQTTSDERFLIIREVDKMNGYVNVFYIDFNSSEKALRPLVMRLGFDENLKILDNCGDYFIASSYKSVNNGMLIKIDPKSPRDWKVLIPEYNSALLLEAKLLEDKIITVYQSNRKQQIVIFDYQAKVLHSIELPFGIAADEFNGEKTDQQLLFSFSGYTQPKVVYTLDLNSYKIKPLKATVVSFDYRNFQTRNLEYESSDGTMIPLFLIFKKDLDLTKESPLLLKAYGGFGAVSLPYFQPGIVHFLKEGGIFAFANIRGGGDKGKEWAFDGRGKYKQNSFDDFIAAAEYLIKEKYTSPDLLAISGASNGGLVVAAALTQRPELFKVAVPVVAPLDMLRFENFTVGHMHTNEYGSVNDSLGFNSLLSYSPLHNVQENVNYPATLIMTSEFDDRVPPFHSYKFAARLQNRAAQKNPVLLRVEKGAGHYGAVSSFKGKLKEEADFYDFILYYLTKN